MFLKPIVFRFNMEIVKDNKNREIIKIDDNGTILIGRYVDMAEDCKKFICEIYCDLTQTDPKIVMDFLNFESDEGEFCS